MLSLKQFGIWICSLILIVPVGFMGCGPKEKPTEEPTESEGGAE